MKKLPLFLFLIVFSSFAFAFPENTTIQGVLRDTTTGEYVNGTIAFNITFYNISNDAVLLSNSQNLSVRNGTWNYNIPISSNIFSQDAYFVLGANGDTFPAALISATPYAWMCQTSDNSNSLDGQSSSYYLNTGSKVGNTTAEIWSIIQNGTFAYLNQIIDYDNATIQRTYDAVATSWNSSGSNTFLADINDNVIIGGVSASAKLDVNGTISSDRSSVTTGQPTFYKALQSDGATLSLQFVETATGVMPANIWQYRMGGSTKDLVYSYYDAFPLLYLAFSGSKVGIGTSIPQLTTHINSSTTQRTLELETTATSGKQLVFVDSASTGNSNVMIGSTGDSMSFYTGSSGVNTLTLDSNGYLGVGTTSPSQKLSVIGTGEMQAIVAGRTGSENHYNSSALDLLEYIIAGEGEFGTANAYGFRWQLDGASNKLLLKSGAGTTVNDRLAINRDNGYMGILTTSPNTPLDVDGRLTIRDTTALALQLYGESGSTQWGFGSSGATNDDSFLIYDNVAGTTPFRILNGSGYVGIGVGTPDSIFDVTVPSGDKIHFDGAGDLFLDMDRASSSSAGRVRFQTAASDEFEVGLKGSVAGFHITDGSVNELVTVLSSGNVGIGTTTPDTKLHLVGNLTIEQTGGGSQAGIWHNGTGICIGSC